MSIPAQKPKAGNILKTKGGKTVFSAAKAGKIQKRSQLQETV
jgi:hypothetical protein